jgi:hypothetical protein
LNGVRRRNSTWLASSFSGCAPLCRISRRSSTAAAASVSGLGRRVEPLDHRC